MKIAACMFEEMGYDVPLEAIAEKAGVGRGTLYRNFKDRSALAIEVVSLRLDEVSQDMARYPDAMDAFTFFLSRVGLLAVLHAPGIDHFSKDDALTTQSSEILQRAQEMFERHLARVQATGRVRSDMTLADFSLLARMLRAVATDLPDKDRPHAISRALTLLIEGIGVVKFQPNTHPINFN
ncbi:MAG: TetR/AcrR family transcriptional regulator [Sphingobium sp.]